jgi:hypothetical protein
MFAGQIGLSAAAAKTASVVIVASAAVCVLFARLLL